LLEEDWDLITILDACRHDMFEEIHGFDGEYERYRSQAAATIPWFEKNFVEAPDDELGDIIYVTANPNASSQRIDEDRFYHLEEVFKYGYNDTLRTTPADIVTDAAVRLHHQHPDKRVVVHYMQPHLPFIGSDYYDPEKFAPLEDMIDQVVEGSDGRELDDDVLNAVEKRDEYERGLNFEPFLAMRDGKLSREKLKSAYWDNLEYVIEEVERLVRYVSGQVVITADHGNGMGEAGVYGHPYWGTIEQTIMVPWLEVTGKEESPPRDLLEAPQDRTGSIDTDIEKQLQYLGYH